MAFPIFLFVNLLMEDILWSTWGPVLFYCSFLTLWCWHQDGALCFLPVQHVSIIHNNKPLTCKRVYCTLIPSVSCHCGQFLCFLLFPVCVFFILSFSNWQQFTLSIYFLPHTAGPVFMLLLQDRWQEDAFKCTLLVSFLDWLVLNLVVSLTGYSCEYHTKQSAEPSCVPVGCLSHAFFQMMVCRSAVNCLNCQRVVLLSQDRQWEGTLTCTLLCF
jgi:hypothetical protein